MAIDWGQAYQTASSTDAPVASAAPASAGVDWGQAYQAANSVGNNSLPPAAPVSTGVMPTLNAAAAGLLQGAAAPGYFINRAVMAPINYVRNLNGVAPLPSPAPNLTGYAAANPTAFNMGNLAGQVGTAVPTIEATGLGDAISAIPSLSGRLGASAASGALQTGVANPDASANQIALGTALGAGGQALGEGVNAAAQGMVGTIPASKQALQGAMQRLGIPTTGDAALPLPYQTGSYAGQRFYENAISKAPYSGAPADTQALGNMLNSKVNDVVNSFGIDPDAAPIDLKQGIAQDINNSYGNNVANHNASYAQMNQQAQAAGLNSIPLPALKSSLNQVLTDSQDPMKILTKTAPNSDAVDLANDQLGALQQLAPNPSLQAAGLTAPGDGISFSDATKMDPQFNQSIRDNFDNPSVKSVLQNVQQALRSDIGNAVQNSNNPDLMNSWANNRQNFAQNVVPFFDDSSPLSQYVAATGKTVSAPDDIVTQLVKPGANGNATQLAQSLNLVPQMQPKLGYLYLKQGTDLEKNATADDANTVLNNFGKLNGDVADSLLGPQQAQTLRDVMTVKKSMGTLGNTLFNANTGQQAAYWDAIKAAAAPAVGAYMHFGPTLEGLGYGLAGTAGTIGAGRAANAFVRSPLAISIANGNPLVNTGNLAGQTSPIINYLAGQN